MANFYTNDGGATWYSDSEYNNVVSIATITSGDYIVGSNLTAYVEGSGWWAAGLNLDGVNFTLTQGQVYIKGVGSVSGIILPSNIDGWLFEDLGDSLELVDFSNVTSMSSTTFLNSNLRNVDFSNVTNIEAANFYSPILTGASLPSSFSGFLGNSSYGTYFTNGVAETTGLANNNGDGIWNGQLYVNAVLNATYTGWLWGTSTFYVNGQATPLNQYGHGQWNGGTYVSGVIVNPAGGLQAFYRLSDLTDSSGNGKTLTNNGNVTFASGKIGNAALFNGTNRLYTESFSTIDTSQPFCVSFWSKPTANTVGTVCANGTGVGFNIHNDGAGNLNFNNGQSADCSVPDAFVVGVWKHYVCMVSNGNTIVYIDGSQVYNQQSNASYSTTINSLSIGSYDGNQLMFNGSIDAVGVWNRALTEAEVSALYNSGAGLELGAIIPTPTPTPTPTETPDPSYYGYYGNRPVVKLNGKTTFSGKIKFIDPMGYNS